MPFAICPLPSRSSLRISGFKVQGSRFKVRALGFSCPLPSALCHLPSPASPDTGRPPPRVPCNNSSPLPMRPARTGRFEISNFQSLIPGFNPRPARSRPRAIALRHAGASAWEGEGGGLPTLLPAQAPAERHIYSTTVPTSPSSSAQERHVTPASHARKTPHRGRSTLCHLPFAISRLPSDFGPSAFGFGCPLPSASPDTGGPPPWVPCNNTSPFPCAPRARGVPSVPSVPSVPFLTHHASVAALPLRAPVVFSSLFPKNPA